jgi:hypothetical protein
MPVNLRSAVTAILMLVASACSTLAQTKPLPVLLWKLPHPQWAAPDGVLPRDYVEGANKLLAAGFGDPRGGEYRVIYPGLTLNRYDPQSLAVVKELKETRGWYFPAKDGLPPYAVLVNGLTCQPAKVGPKADLAREIEQAIATDSAFWDVRFDVGELERSDGILLLCLSGHINEARKLADLLPERRVHITPGVKKLDILDALESFWSELGFYKLNAFIGGQMELAYQTGTLEHSVYYI